MTLIADLDKTIRQLLIDEMPIKNSEIEIVFDQPTREWSGHINKPTINFFLYDLRENPHLRTHQWEALTNGRTGLPAGNHLQHQKRTPLRVDCFYMITTWSPKHSQQVEDEHRLLTNALMTLFRFPVLPEERLEGRLRNPTFEIHAALARHDVLTNPAEVWGALDNEMRPSISYVVTLAFDPWDVVSGSDVRTFTLFTGQEQRPTVLRNRRLQADTERQALNLIGGTVRNRAQANAPVINLEVEIADTGLFTRTDTQGRFRFRGLLPGTYTLVARPGHGDPVSKVITVPKKTKDENYDLALDFNATVSENAETREPKAPDPTEK